jgi:hypothetical protein
MTILAIDPYFVANPGFSTLRLGLAGIANESHSHRLRRRAAPGEAAVFNDSAEGGDARQAIDAAADYQARVDSLSIR